MTQAKLLFHGSTQKKLQLNPSLGIGDGHHDHHVALYASDHIRLAQLFAIQYVALTDAARFKILYEDQDFFVQLFQTEVNWAQRGYVYFCCSSTFVELEPFQWVSHSLVRPEWRIEIQPQALESWIRRSG